MGKFSVRSLWRPSIAQTTTGRRLYAATVGLVALAALLAAPFAFDRLTSDGDRSKSFLWDFLGHEETPCMSGNAYVLDGAGGSIIIGNRYPECVEQYALIWPMYLFAILCILFVGFAAIGVIHLADEYDNLREWMKGPSAPLTIRNDGWPHLHVSFVTSQGESSAPPVDGTPPAVRSMTIEEHIASLGVQTPNDTERFKPPAQTHN